MEWMVKNVWSGICYEISCCKNVHYYCMRIIACLYILSDIIMQQQLMHRVSRSLRQICTSLSASSLPDLWEPAVMYLHCWLWAWKWKNDWGWAKTGSEGPHRCRFVAWTGSVLAATHHCRFKPRADSDFDLSLSVLANNWQWQSLQHKKATAVLCFLLSSIPRTEARVWALPSIVVSALHHEASAWILKNGLIFLL